MKTALMLTTVILLSSNAAFAADCVAAKDTAIDVLRKQPYVAMQHSDSDEMRQFSKQISLSRMFASVNQLKAMQTPRNDGTPPLPGTPTQQQRNEQTDKIQKVLAYIQDVVDHATWNFTILGQDSYDPSSQKYTCSGTVTLTLNSRGAVPFSEGKSSTPSSAGIPVVYTVSPNLAVGGDAYFVTLNYGQ